MSLLCKNKSIYNGAMVSLSSCINSVCKEYSSSLLNHGLYTILWFQPLDIEKVELMIVYNVDFDAVIMNKY